MKTPEEICPDLPEWPKRWHGVKQDIPYGELLLETIRPFVVHLIYSGIKEKTIRVHLDNLWLLGGEIIREVNMSDDYNIPPEENLLRNIDHGGGPYCRHINTDEHQRSFDATCRKLCKFLLTKRKIG